MARPKNRRQQVYAKRKLSRKPKTKKTVIVVDESVLGGFKDRDKISTAQVRGIAKRSARRIKKTGKKDSWDIVSTHVISGRGRPTFMAGPQAGQPQGPQNILTESTVIRSFRYSSKTKLLEITFINGGTWKYFNVPRLVVKGLQQAGVYGSVGRYFHKMIRLKYGDTKK